MKCCESQITSIARSGATPRTRDVAASFNALLFAQAFAPLAKAMGFYGDTVVALAARRMALGERGGLTDRLEHAIEDAARTGPSAAGSA
ncbi:MAG: hypothetical protein NVSMB21_14870 [Vulcanimicrobiaceae bacterium]